MITSDIQLPLYISNPAIPSHAARVHAELSGLTSYIDAGWKIEICGTAPHLRATAERHHNGQFQFVHDTATELQDAIERIAAAMDSAT